MRKIIIGLWLIILIATSYYLISQDIHWSLAELPQILQSKINATGYTGVYLFVGLTLIRPLLLLPGSALILVGGLLFGPIGILYSLAGESLAAGFAFYIARYLGHKFIEEHTGQKFKNFEHKLEEHTFRSVILLRLMIIVPNDLISYAAGVSNIAFGRFFVASTIGLAPHSFLYNLTAGGIHDISSLIWPAIIVMTGVLFGKTIHYEYQKHKQKQLRLIADVHDV